MYYTYIIWSHSFEIFYKSVTQDPDNFLLEHNSNLNHFTAGKGPWAILFLKKHISKREAFAELKWFKNLNQKSIQKLIDSKENLCKGLY